MVFSCTDCNIYYMKYITLMSTVLFYLYDEIKKQNNNTKVCKN